MTTMGKWKKAPPELVQRFTSALAATLGAEPRTMFGYPAAFVNGQMFAGVFADRLFVRLPEEGREELVQQGGRPFEPMPGRPMREYVEVPASILWSDTSLRSWLRRAFDYGRSLGPKAAGQKLAKAKPAGRNAKRR